MNFLCDLTAISEFFKHRNNPKKHSLVLQGLYYIYTLYAKNMKYRLSILF